MANGEGADDDVCDPCADSTYKANSGNVGCTSCGAHFTTNGLGKDEASSCVCKASFTLNATMNECLCPPGTDLNSDNGLCQSCTPRFTFARFLLGLPNWLVPAGLQGAVTLRLYCLRRWQGLDDGSCRSVEQLRFMRGWKTLGGRRNICG